MAYTTTDLLASIKRRAQLPDANGALSDADILAIATMAMRTQIQPLIRSVREDYGVITQRQALVDGQQQYPIPSRAEGGSVRDVWLETVTTPVRQQQLVYIPPEDRPVYYDTRNPWWGSTLAYSVEGNDLWLSPVPDASAASMFTLVVRYVLRPGRFVEVSACDVVDLWSPSPLPAEIATFATSVFSTGATIDVIGASPPFRPRIIGATTGTITGTTIDLPTLAGVIEAPVAGDYVCETDTTCVLAVPVEAQEALESATLVHVYEALGYTGDLQSAVAIRDMQMQAVRVLMEPRTEGAARAIFDPYSPLRRGRRRGVW